MEPRRWVRKQQGAIPDDDGDDALGTLFYEGLSGRNSGRYRQPTKRNLNVPRISRPTKPELTGRSSHLVPSRRARLPTEMICAMSH